MEEIVNGLRGVVKLIIVGSLVAIFLVWSFICHYTIRDSHKRLVRFSRNTQFFARLILKVLNLDFKITNKPFDQQKFLMVSNQGRTIDTHVFGLRKKLGGWGDNIETIRGIGYRVRVENA